MVRETKTGRRVGERQQEELLLFFPSFTLHLWLSLTLLVVLLASGCANVRSGMDFPPLLAQDEVVRPYMKLAVVQVSRDTFGTFQELSNEDYKWAHEALREEAAKIGADAVILPEVRLEASSTSYLLFPSSHLDARGIAIRFR